MNGMKAMFDDMRSGGGGMPAPESAPPEEEMGGGGMTCPSCGAKFVIEAPEEEVPMPEEGMEG